MAVLWLEAVGEGGGPGAGRETGTRQSSTEEVAKP